MATAVDVVAQKDMPIVIGRVGENEYRRILFPIKEWLDQYPDASAALTHKRNGDTDGYPVSSTEDDGEYLYWTVTSGDTAKEGCGLAQLTLTSDGTIIKSVIFKTATLPSLADAEDPPEPWQSWADEITKVANDAKGYAEDAKEYADEAAASLAELEAVAAVRYDTPSQGLTEQEKENARTNIGARTISVSGTSLIIS